MWKGLRTGEASLTRNTLKLLLVCAVTLVCTYLTGRAALILLPFLIGFSLSRMLDKPVGFLHKKLRLSRTIGSGLGVALIVLVICSLLGVLFFSLYVEMRGVIIQLPSLYNKFVVYAERLIEYIGTEYSEWFTPQIMDELELLVHNLRDAVLSLINRVSRGVWNTAVSAPQMFIGFMMMFFSTFFFLRDRDRIVGFFEHQIPTKWIDFFHRARKELSVSLFAYIRAILILASITFVELLIGLTILRLPYAILIAFLCAVLDALPAIGTGWVLTPWSIVCFVMGNYRLGIGLLVLYLITWLVRQLLEARVVGGQVGIHPLLLLFSMYLGMQLFGILGLLVGPLMAIVLRSFLRIYFSGRSLKQVLYEGMDELRPAQDEDIPA